MKYVIVEKGKCLFVDDNKQRLMKTVEFLPQYCVVDIKEVADNEIELGFDNCYYMRGKAPIQSIDEYNHQVEESRHNAYEKRTDFLILQRLRKIALGTWCEEDEKKYIANMKKKSEQIQKEFPYRQEEIINDR